MDFQALGFINLVLIVRSCLCVVLCVLQLLLRVLPFTRISSVNTLVLYAVRGLGV